MDPSVGRFITRDTWMGDYSQPLSLNRWMYTAGNPIKYSDPSGKFYCPCGWDSESGSCHPCPDWWGESDNPLIAVITQNPPASGLDWAKLVALLVAAGCLYVANQATENIDIDFEQDSYWQFYYIELGEYASETLSSHHWLTQELAYLSHIPGISGKNEFIDTLNDEYESVYNRGSFWKEDLYFGRIFEGERIIAYYLTNKLISVSTKAHAYDLHVTNFSSIQWVEVKWSEAGNVPSLQTIKKTIRQAKNANFPSNSFLLEVTNLNKSTIEWLNENGGKELDQPLLNELP